MNVEEFKEEYGVEKFYTYHQVKKSETTIEFGWAEALEIDLTGKVILSRISLDPSMDNATSLKDYEEYFYRLTGLTADEFIQKWEPSPVELSNYWKGAHPNTEEGLEEFIMKVAYLIRDGKGFEHKFSRFPASYELLDLSLISDLNEEEEAS